MREMRRHLEGNGSGDDSWDEDDYDENGRREAFTRLRAMDESSAAPVVRLPCIVGEQGSSKLDRGEAKRKPANNGVPQFQIFEDDDDEKECYLEGIYEVNNHIERFSMNDRSAEKWKASKVPLKKLNSCVSSFSVFQDDDEKENTDPQTNKVVKKPILKLRKCLIRDMSVEEHLAMMYESKEANQPVNVKGVARKINFDDEDDD
ncbi:hypothetical protein OESDEN_23640 [Oesophagostomum dentatum]|uniref:Uncharacterized protein n=1 Tax=Oesophagostomum dentatum TaxID=61180 RepID=A0A0B1S0L8_OESDE|nr:hypothetical protein OESDEN_23640 [Oesophagostomum dentatum]